MKILVIVLYYFDIMLLMRIFEEDVDFVYCRFIFVNEVVRIFVDWVGVFVSIFFGGCY